MSVSLDANSSADVTGTQVTSLTSSNLTVGSVSNRVVIAQLSWEFAITGRSVNWDQLGTPTACTEIKFAQETTNNRSAGLYGLVNPVAGAKQCKAAWTTTSDVSMNMTSFQGVDQTGGTTTFANAISATGATGNPSLTITSATGNMTVDSVATNGSVSSPTQTQLYADNSVTEGGGASRAAGAATVTHGWTQTPSDSWAQVGCSLTAAAAVSDTQEWRGCYPRSRPNTDTNSIY